MERIKVLVTGSAGFIGFHVSKLLLDNDFDVIGIDNLNDYYDRKLKIEREKILKKNKHYFSINDDIAKDQVLYNIFDQFRPSFIVHLAAQAGVRYSIENPLSYIQNNILGSFYLLEASRFFPPQHILVASTSSVYGGNIHMPYKETDRTDHQASFYASTKKAVESISHNYSHIYNLPITVFRFFTVYGPWGRPDMAIFKFVKAILNEDSIEIFNNGQMMRDFTYIDDLVMSVYLLLKCIPENKITKFKGDSISPIAPFRVVNIGKSKPDKLLDFIEVIEKTLNKKSKKVYKPMQPGDVESTWADIELLDQLIGYSPRTELKDGVTSFIKWYKSYYLKNS